MSFRPSGNKQFVGHVLGDIDSVDCKPSILRLSYEVPLTGEWIFDNIVDFLTLA